VHQQIVLVQQHADIIMVLATEPGGTELLCSLYAYIGEIAKLIEPRSITVQANKA
jgi:hypothetical protein